jgi:hypothetical protein
MCSVTQVIAERNKAVQDLVDVKRKFVTMARRKQAEYAAKVREQLTTCLLVFAKDYLHGGKSLELHSALP